MSNGRLTPVTVITGVEKGLGLALTESLLKREYKVFGGYHNVINDGLKALCVNYPEHLKLHQVDIGNTASTETFCDYIRKHSETVDILINNAGVLGDIDSRLSDKIDYEDIIRTFNVNTVGSLRMTNGLIEQIIISERKTIVNICSEAGSIADNYREGWFGYCMSKAAMNMSGSIVHQTLKKKQGRVMQIHPGYLKTYMHGYYNDKGELTANEASEMIVTIIKQQLKEPISEQPVYISSEGKKLHW